MAQSAAKTIALRTLQTNSKTHDYYWRETDTDDNDKVFGGSNLSVSPTGQEDVLIWAVSSDSYDDLM